MKHLTAAKLKQLAIDVELELKYMAQLRTEMERVDRLIAASPQLADILCENQALKLHNFYTGCERIFRLVAADLNGDFPGGYDWHKRLLKRMAVAYEGRPALLSEQTVHALEKYLAFRHVVRNIYGYELETERVRQLVAEQASVWNQFRDEVQAFVTWLRQTADRLA